MKTAEKLPSSRVSNYGKEIRRFKIAINTACPLRCEYCFIDKDSGEVVSWESVQGAVKMLLSSPGRVKKLLIYGGEPFLRFDLVQKIALYARSEAKKYSKDLDLSLCTSGVAVKRERLEFLKDQRFFLSVSMDGDAETHNERRKFLGGKGTWDKIAPNLPLIFKVMGKRPLADPISASAFAALGNLLIPLKRYEEAGRSLLQALRIYPKHPEAARGLAQLAGLKW